MVRSLIKRFQQLNESEIIENVFIKNEKNIADENKKQLREGFTSDGTRLRRYGDPGYALRKNLQNPVPGYGNPDFYLKGDFYRRWEVRIDGDIIRNVLNDPKSGFLITRDPNIIGLGGNYRKELIVNKIRPDLFLALRNNIGI